jgi:GTP-binding protein Era
MSSSLLHVGFVALIGRPSTGKSALMNRLTGQPTSIVSSLPQTTRQRIRGIVTEENGQIIFTDTPGIHESERKFNHYMLEQAAKAIEEADVVLYLLDISRKPGLEEKLIADIVKKCNKPFVIGLNKIDKKTKHSQEYALFTQMLFPEHTIFPISAQTGDGLTALKTALFNLLPLGPKLYSDDIYTDQEPAFRISEIIRKHAMTSVKEEIPHSIYVDVADLEMKGSKLWARVFIMVERESQKGMLVGKGGLTIRNIRINSLKELATIFPYKVLLELQVKVDKEWRHNDHRLKKILA